MSDKPLGKEAEAAMVDELMVDVFENSTGGRFHVSSLCRFVTPAALKVRITKPTYHANACAYCHDESL
jgi:hypothetical protein